VADDFLKTIAAYKLDVLKAKSAYYENLKKNTKPVTPNRRYEVFKKAVSKPGQINLIAEIKKASPSAGLIRDDFNVSQIAKVYVENNAAAISVLTEDKYFLGGFSYLKKVNDEFNLPTLMKDFIIHEHQIYEGAFYGASAVLLIVAMLSHSQLLELMEVAHMFGLDCLIEVHNEHEIERALAADAEIIGVNNRDLTTLQVDMANCERMIRHIPEGKIIVAESGLKTKDDIKHVKELGAHAVLIGEAFMRARNIGDKIKEVMGR
jgi:indole-3-glycerol phosphate synthase